MIKTISETFIKPKYLVEEAKKPVYLTPSELKLLPLDYIQKGLLFPKLHLQEENSNNVDTLLDRLKESLSIALVHFYPLAGQLEIQVHQDEHSSLIYVNPNKGPGAKFIHASIDLTVYDILSPIDVPESVYSFFDHNGVKSYDGYNDSLLTVQVTELIDGIFIGWSINHSVVDGPSYWHFFNSWSEIYNASLNGRDNSSNITLCRPPIHKKWFVEGTGPIIKIPFTHRDELIVGQQKLNRTPSLRYRIFHFPAESILGIQAKVNESKNNEEEPISSFHTFCALVWRCVTKARNNRSSSSTTSTGNFYNDAETSCQMIVDTRGVLEPPLSENYFGVSIQAIFVTCKANELVENNLSWAGRMLSRRYTESQKDEVVRSSDMQWTKSPRFLKPGEVIYTPSVVVLNSLGFDVYGDKFGMGKALAVLDGVGHTFDGKMLCYPGRKGGGSVELGIFLDPDHMSALESDEEFMMWVRS